MGFNSRHNAKLADVCFSCLVSIKTKFGRLFLSVLPGQFGDQTTVLLMSLKIPFLKLLLFIELSTYLACRFSLLLNKSSLIFKLIIDLLKFIIFVK